VAEVSAATITARARPAAVDRVEDVQRALGQLAPRLVGERLAGHHQRPRAAIVDGAVAHQHEQRAAQPVGVDLPTAGQEEVQRAQLAAGVQRVDRGPHPTLDVAGAIDLGGDEREQPLAVGVADDRGAPRRRGLRRQRVEPRDGAVVREHQRAAAERVGVGKRGGADGLLPHVGHHHPRAGRGGDRLERRRPLRARGVAVHRPAVAVVDRHAPAVGVLGRQRPQAARCVAQERARAHRPGREHAEHPAHRSHYRPPPPRREFLVG
jgi:hypothetical protein